MMKKYQLYIFCVLLISFLSGYGAIPLFEEDTLYEVPLSCPLLSDRIIESQATSVLIVGAGPAGLMAAAILDAYNIKFKIIESKPKQQKYSKATGLHQTTLKLLKRLGILDNVITQAIELEGNNIYCDGEKINYIQFHQGNEDFDKNISLDQFILESILLNKLIENEKNVDFNKELIGIHQNNNFISALIYNKEKKDYEEIQAKYIIAADGARSIVRNLLDSSFPGSGTGIINFTLDCESEENKLNHNQMYQFITKENRLVIVPIVGKDRFKFSGNIPVQGFDLLNKDFNLLDNKLKKIIEERAGIKLVCDQLENLSFYKIHAKIADKFSSDRIFLIGDAAHTFSPAGGYGLNSGIEDAVNISWRLALIESNISEPNLASFYEQERKINTFLIDKDSKQKSFD